jgi:polysaccharide biosynthesis protein PslA
LDRISRGTDIESLEFIDETAANADNSQTRSRSVLRALPVVRDVSGLPLTTINNVPVAPEMSAVRRRNLKLKRALDIVLSGLALIAIAVPLLMMAVTVRLTSRGPVLFRQARVGEGSRLFTMLKFRTVRIEHTDPSGLTQVEIGDARLTPIGGFLRATSLDELPQLINIIKGDMSLIGPRPMVPGQHADGRDYRQVVPYYDFRSSMKPGLSGWAQANGLRGPTDDRDAAVARIDHDCAYIQNLSLRLDLHIMIKTLCSQFLRNTGL